MFEVGVDEVGRGPLAGPVVAAAVMLEPEDDFPYTDSKLMTPKKRMHVFSHLLSNAKAWSVGIVGVQRIDEINILQASLEAMHIAVKRIYIDGANVLVDGNKLPHWDYPSKAIIKGDLTQRCIAAASNIAKVVRDELMVAYSERFPNYGFESHKGYPTKHHTDAMMEWGLTPIHRRSYAPVKKILEHC